MSSPVSCLNAFLREIASRAYVWKGKLVVQTILYSFSSFGNSFSLFTSPKKFLLLFISCSFTELELFKSKHKMSAEFYYKAMVKLC